MSATITVKLDTRALDKLAASLNMETDRVIASAAFQVEAEAKVRAPVDTGALKNSIHTEPKGNKTYWVSDAVEYGIYQEFGTHRMSAHPFMMPAVEKVRKLLDKMFAEIVK
jgi:HK97 gp10 family phage protein